MLKNILNLEGAQELSKVEQKSIHGGKTVCTDPLPGGWDPGANGGQGGQIWTQNCTTSFLGIITGRYVRTFTTLIPY